jgi:hypothetical protein
MTRWLRENWRILWNGSRWPYRQKAAWISVGAWTFALATVGFSIVADIITGQYAWLPWVLAWGVFDSVMLHRTIQGLLWRRRVDKWRSAGAWRS